MTSILQMGFAYCCCKSTESICTACLGNTSTSTTGRKRSVLLLSLTIAAALLFQWVLTPSILSKNHTWWTIIQSIPGLGLMIQSAWTNGCDIYATHDLTLQCVGNSAVYRPTCVATLFFLSSAIATKSNPRLNRMAWPAKYGIFGILVVITMFLPNQPIFATCYVILFRLLAIVFIILQQVILIDVAYNWNDRWVANSTHCELNEWGTGAKWLRGIIASCVLLYGLSIMGIIGLHWQFADCPENRGVIVITVIGIVFVTFVQLTGREGSLLTSAVISLYVTYLAYSSVSKNPNTMCNPTLGKDDVWGIGFGLLLTMISLVWVGWSWTAEVRLNDRKTLQSANTVSVSHNKRDIGTRDIDDLDLDTPFLDSDHDSTNDESLTHRSGTSLWKLNVVLALVSCWVAAFLTGWGSIQGTVGDKGEHTEANPTVGRVNMIMIALSQWMTLGLYTWTLMAPRIYPNRDFS